MKQSQTTQRLSLVRKQFLREVDGTIFRIADGAADFVFEQLTNDGRDPADTGPSSEELRLDVEIQFAVETMLATNLGRESAGGDPQVLRPHRLIGDGKRSLCTRRLRATE